MARKAHGTKPMSHADIAQRCNLSRASVSTLSKKRKWDGTPIDIVASFSAACGVNLTNPKRTTEFMRKASKKYLVGANKAQRKFLSSIMRNQPA